MKERPIIFGAESVLAILAGRKTQTRRVVKPGHLYEPTDEGIDILWATGQIRCPYGEPGDGLWAKEAWRIDSWNGDDRQITVEYKADGSVRLDWITIEDEELFERLWRQSTDDCIRAGLGCEDEYFWPRGETPCRWRSPIHMPRSASRILLHIKGVRVERLQDITAKDVEAEGINVVAHLPAFPSPGANLGKLIEQISKRLFAEHWDALNAKRGYPWESNPWVWVIEFERIAP